MSDLGIGLLLFACLLLAVGVIRFFSWLTELQEEHGSVGRAGVNTIKKYVAPRPRVMSREIVQTTQTRQTDEADRRVSVADQWLDRLEVDRTREAVVDLLVYSGWSVSDMRKANILRGDNALIGPEVEAARLRLGIVGEPRKLRVRDDQGERLIPMDA